MSEPLRPLSLGEILDRTVQLYRRNFLLFAGTSAPPSVVMIALFLGVFGAGVYFSRSGSTAAPAHAVVVAIVVIAAIVVLVPLEIGATVVSQSALVRAGISANLGHRLTIREALRSVWPRFWRYLGLVLLQGIFVGVIPGAIAGAAVTVVVVVAQFAGGGVGTGALLGVLIFLIIAAALVAVVLLLLTYSLAMPICVAEQKPAWESMQRSLKLTKGTRWRIFLMLVLIWVLSMVVSMAAYIPLTILIVLVTAFLHAGPAATIVLVIGEVANIVVNFAIQVLVTPVYATSLVLFYVDQRVRTEGYDIEWMMEQAGLTGGMPVDKPAAPDAMAPNAAGDAGAGIG